MLHGIHPLLTGQLLHVLDDLGHSDAIVIADAHFPAERLGARVLTLPGTSAPEVVAAILTVMPVDEAPGLSLMESAEGTLREVQRELIAAAGVSAEATELIERYAFYKRAGAAMAIVRTGEARSYGNAILHKGLVVPATAAQR